jgi:hypothetical protein
LYADTIQAAPEQQRCVRESHVLLRNQDIDYLLALDGA